MADNLSEGDLVFTCAGNGVSSLLTMPVPGVSLEDVSKMTYIMQVERGVPTGDLNPIRNYLDMMKGGKISRLIQPAQAIHIIAVGPGSYDRLMNHNLWLHTLPDCTTYQLAIDNLKKWGAWEAVPSSIREYLEAADPSEETVKAEEFEKMRFRIFGVMPGIGQAVEVPVAMERARELGFKPVILAESLSSIEASQAGRYMAAITRTIEHNGQPFEPPCALFSSGEMIVTVGKEKGIGGRNQEFALSAALGIAGSKNIVIASVDTDGTDGPGIQFSKGPEGMPSCFAGGIVDGETVGEMEEAGVDIVAELKKHNTSLPLWKTGNGIVATPDISINDLTVALVTGYNK